MKHQTEIPLTAEIQVTELEEKIADSISCNKVDLGNCQEFPEVEAVAFTLFTKRNGIITKRISVDEENNLKKDSSDCSISQAKDETINKKFSEVPNFLNTVGTNQAVAWGISKYQKVEILSTKRLKKRTQSKSITRTKDNC